MEAANDPIKALLEKTGLSCDDLLQKLLAYKSQEKQSTTETAKCAENENENNVNCDGISSGKTNNQSTDGVCNLDLVHSSKCNNEEEYSSKRDNSSGSNINSSNEIPNLTYVENRDTPEQSTTETAKCAENENENNANCDGISSGKTNDPSTGVVSNLDLGHSSKCHNEEGYSSKRDHSSDSNINSSNEIPNSTYVENRDTPEQSTTETAKCAENENENNANCDGISSGKTNDPSTGVVSNLDLGHSSKCHNEEGYSSKRDHSSDSNINSSNEIPNSTDVENRDTPGQSTTETAKCAENENNVNCDRISSGKNNDPSTDGVSNLDLGHSSKCNNEEEYSSKRDHSSDSNINSSNEIPNSTDVENRDTPESSEKFSKKKSSSAIEGTSETNSTNINKESHLLQMNVGGNISKDYENSSQRSLNLVGVFTLNEDNLKDAVTKETSNNTSDEETTPKNYGDETSETVISRNEDPDLQIAVGNSENEIVSVLQNDCYNKETQSSEQNCSKDDKNEETRKPEKFTIHNVSKINIISNSIIKPENLVNQSPNNNSALIFRKRESISDELVRRLVQRVCDDEIKVAEDQCIDGEQIKRHIDQVSEKSEDITNGVNKRAENDVEVCELENFEVVKPVLKLRNDLFETRDDMKVSLNSESNHDNRKKYVDTTLEQLFFTEKENNTSSDINILENIAADHVYQTKTTNTKMKKVKTESLKKKIVHKALRHLSRTDSKKNKIKHRKETFAISNSENDIDYSFQMPLPKSISESHVDTPESQEEIRKNLKLQLNSLRNRKNTSNIIEQGQSNKVQSISDLKFNYKKQLLNEEVQNNSTSCVSTSTTITVRTDIDEAQTSTSCVRIEDSPGELNEDSQNNVSSLFSLSEDTNFMIVDVQGGVEFPEDDLDDKNREFHYDAIKLTKTNDITKIKGWKNKKFDVIIKGSDSNNQLGETYPCDILSTTNINKDDTNSVETLKMDENSTEELSPFVSNTLEEFLTENSRLNISYKIPKLGAEEGLKEQNYKEIVLPKISDPSQIPETKKKEKPKGIKPKTLAEKRRMLEGKILKKCKSDKENKLAIYKTSYIYFNGHKIFIPSTIRNKCLANISFKPSRCSKQRTPTGKSDIYENEITTPKKLSLLKLWLEKSNIVKYKPGPLSQKRKLQNSETISSWDTVVQKLPKVKLEIIQEFGKKIAPYLIPFLPKSGPVIKNDYLEFALSAVHTKSSNQPSQGFRFSIPYSNNQKYILMRKKRDKCGDNTVCDIDPEKNSVASVIDDIVSYVEIKELGDSIIKDAEPYRENEYEVESKSIVTNGINCVEDNIVKKNIKKRKWEMELQRLSCKVVSVTVEEKEIVDADCTKLYCKLGCICRSLAGASYLPFHCSKKDCMFKCKCSANSEISLCAEGSLLSSDTVTRIEDQAKRNLAKVEKEFTQTIIHANNKTLLIPSSVLSKTKRVKRAPKRYSDFLKNYDVEEENEVACKEKSKVWTDSVFYYCYVELQKLDLKSVVPLCLNHNRYNCSCIEDVVSSKTENKRYVCTDEDSIIEENVTPKKIKPSRTPEGEKSTDESKIKLGDRPPSGNSSETDYSRYSAIYANRKINQKEGCARIRGVHPEFAVRNKIPYYKQKLNIRIRNAESQNKVINFPPPNLNYEEEHSSIIDVTTPVPISGYDRLKLLHNEYIGHKRKQVHEIRHDMEQDSSLPKVNKLKKRHKKSQAPFSEHFEEGIRTDLPYNSIFDGEIVIPTNANKDFVKNLGVKSVAPYMRLLPWNDLLRNYYSLKINIWCSYEKSEKLLINRSHIEPPEGYVDIKHSSRRNGIMMWILTKELPNQTPPELVHLILSPNNEHFEISGVCLKNIPSSQEKRKHKKEIDHEYIENNQTEEVSEIVIENSNTEEPNIDDSNFLEHKNHNNELNVLSLTQHEFCPQYFYLAPICEGTSNEKFPLAIELPVIRPQFRWRMLYLNSNFSFLSFVNNKYSIKYTDLMHILKKAQNSNKTICLQSQQLSSGYTQKNYGIYAVPKYGDRLFIGPYRHDERHGLETLRYLRQSLVSTSYFEMVQGGSNPNHKNALWLTTKMSKIRDKENRASTLSSLRRSSQQSLLKPSLNKLCLDKKGNTEIYNEENEQFAELTPILKATSTISDTSSLVSSVTVPSSELSSTTTLLETNRINDQKNELQQISDHSILLGDCDSFISSVDLEEKPFIKFPEFILFNGRKIKPQEYNRYIMTNIPHFGYLGAIQKEQSKSIYIAWPFGNKVLRFLNVTAAIEFLKRRFTNLLLPIPASFQINLIILTEIDSINHSPIDAKILSGTHICGEFGVLDSRKLTPPLAESLGTTQEDVLKRLANRAQYLVRCRLRTLGLFLLPKDEQLEEVLDNVAYITNSGALEIGKLKEQEKVFVQMKKDLIIRKQNNLTKYMELLMHLPEKQRLMEYDKFRHQFNGRTKHSSSEITTKPSASKEQDVIECIEIEDSDSENETSEVTAITKHMSMPQEKTRLPKKKIAVIESFKSSPVPVESTEKTSKSLKSLKFVKSSPGKLVLLKDNSGPTLSTSLSGMKMTIRNNRVIRRDETNDLNNPNKATQGTNILGGNYQDFDEVIVRNSDRDSLVSLDVSDSDLELFD